MSFVSFWSNNCTTIAASGKGQLAGEHLIGHHPRGIIEFGFGLDVVHIYSILYSTHGIIAASRSIIWRIQAGSFNND
jgi:hypothetical protein